MRLLLGALLIPPALPLIVDFASKKLNCWRKANKDKERRSGILPLRIKTDMRASVTMEAAGCRFYDPRHSLRADLGRGRPVEWKAF